MKKQTLPGSVLSTDAGKLFRKAARLFCDIKDEKIYLTDSYIAFCMNRAEYDYIFRPVTQRDPGTWTIENGQERPKSIDFTAIFKPTDGETLTRCPITFHSGEKRNVQALYCPGFTMFINAAFLAAIDPTARITGTKESAPAIAYNGNDEPVALLLPMRIDDANYKKAVAAYFDETEKPENETTKEQAAKIARLENELKERYAQIDRLEAAANATKEASKEKKDLEKIAASLSKYGKTTIKGAQTASPIIWIKAEKEHAENLKAAGARWSHKKAAWYVVA